MDGRGPLRICAELGRLHIAHVLTYEASADVNLVDGSGHSPLWIACREGHLEVARRLVEANANVTFCEKADSSFVFSGSFFPGSCGYSFFAYIIFYDLRTWKPEQHFL